MSSRLLRRLGWLLLALLVLGLVCLAAFSETYFPTKPFWARAHVIFFLTQAAALLFAAWLRSSRFQIRWEFFAARRFLRVLFGASLAFALLFLAGMSGLSMFTAAPRLAVGFAAGQLIVLAAGVAAAMRNPALRPLLATLGWINGVFVALSFIPLIISFWRPPSPQECAACQRPGLVERLTPAEYSQQFSYPYDILFIPEKQTAVASFKMAGNLCLPFYDKDAANRLVAVDLHDIDRPAVRVLPLPGYMPEWLAYDESRRELLVTRVGRQRRFAVSSIALGDDNAFGDLRTKELNFEPNGVMVAPEERRFHVVGIEREWATFDLLSFREISRRALAVPIEVNFNMSHSRGSPFVYFATIGLHVIQYDLAKETARWLTAFTGSGYLQEARASRRLVQADSIGHAIRIIDADTMTTLLVKRVDYTPRPVRVDEDRDLVFVGDWFRGRVYGYRLSTLAPVFDAVDVGPYLRAMAYDSERQLLFTGSKCGLLQVRIGEILAGSRAGAH